MRRVFTCRDCNKSWEVWQDMDAAFPTNCETCNSKEIFQELSTNIVCNFIEANVMTFEKAASINGRRIGKEQLDIMVDKDPVARARKEAKENKKKVDKYYKDLF